MANVTIRTTRKRKKVLEAFSAGGTVKEACAAAGISRNALNEWRRDDPGFDAACIDALEEGTDDLEAVARTRAKEKSDLLLMFILKKRRPEFRENHKVEVEAGDNLGNMFDVLRQSAQATQPEAPVTPEADSNPEG